MLKWSVLKSEFFEIEGFILITLPHHLQLENSNETLVVAIFDIKFHNDMTWLPWGSFYAVLLLYTH